MKNADGIFRFPALAAILMLLTGLGGCAYQIDAEPVVTAGVAVQPGERIQGRFAVLINAEALDAPLQTRGILCGAHRYSAHMSGAYEATVTAVLARWLEDFEVVEEAGAKGFDGQISLLVTSIGARVKSASGSLGFDNIADLELSSLMVIRDRQGSVIHKFLKSEGQATRFMGLGCKAVETVMEAATQEALKDLVRAIERALEPLRATSKGVES